MTGTYAGFRTASITEGTRTGSSFATNGSVIAAYAFETTYGGYEIGSGSSESRSVSAPGFAV